VKVSKTTTLSMLIISITVVLTILISQLLSIKDGSLIRNNSIPLMIAYFFAFLTMLFSISYLSRSKSNTSKNRGATHVFKSAVASFAGAGGVFIFLVLVAFIISGETGVELMFSNLMAILGIFMLILFPVVFFKMSK